ncbi:hypothetical protein Rhow_000649 [Rhodococcus wratislaviensis]|uniref:Uncharacterized protein n=1 Tax=Rhodococcus wratislaviensis TaxID=44752 RepID=A0A402C2D8_RHOWR|nr:hypothetical protein [Rhodococcus wratislaviensis]GCE37803.1 hypothetical protein Rhow_000649 [Rhodococcus wratislaviensis]
MSEYQYYEFLAVDRPLDDRQLAEVRALSTRARITATSFVNEYHWGNFRGDPNRMMGRYYDAHLYLANWGTQRIMLRLPRGLLDIDVARDYCVGDQVMAWTTGEYLVLDLTSEDEDGDFDPDAVAPMSAIVGVRAELAAGDLRPLHLAWLAGYGTAEADDYAVDRNADQELEPPVPPGLATLTAAQRALADFLRVDDDLLAVAAQTSAPLAETTDVTGQLAAWVQDLPVAEKDRLLLRIVEDPAVTVRAEMLRRFHGAYRTPLAAPPRRTVADLLDAAARRRGDRERQVAARRAEQQARRHKARSLAREKRIDELARDEEATWSRIDAMIATRKPIEYDAAVALLTDLQTLAEREGRGDIFTQRSQALRHTHARKPRLIERLDRAGV